MIENDHNAQTMTNDSSNYSLSFFEDGRMGIKEDCNSDYGTYAVERSKIDFGSMALTIALCQRPSLDNQFLQLNGRTRIGRKYPTYDVAPIGTVFEVIGVSPDSERWVVKLPPSPDISKEGNGGVTARYTGMREKSICQWFTLPTIDTVESPDPQAMALVAIFIIDQFPQRNR